MLHPGKYQHITKQRNYGVSTSECHQEQSFNRERKTSLCDFNTSLRLKKWKLKCCVLFFRPSMWFGDYSSKQQVIAKYPLFCIFFLIREATKALPPPLLVNLVAIGFFLVKNKVQRKLFFLVAGLYPCFAYSLSIKENYKLNHCTTCTRSLGPFHIVTYKELVKTSWT